MSTDLYLTLEEVLEMENRWSIELAHREANQKFGFRDYQMRDKRAIKLMQLSFLAWTIIYSKGNWQGFQDRNWGDEAL